MAVAPTNVIGLTGGIATGKSAVSNMFRKLGAFVVDADKIARELIVPDSPIVNQLVNSLGSEIQREDGGIDRQRLRERIIDDEDARLILNNIMHPAIIAREEELVQGSSASVIIVDAALLIETESYKRFQNVLLVYVPRFVQLKRLMERDNMSEATASRFIATQMDIEEKKKFVNHIIDNSGTFSQTEKQVRRLYVLFSA
ncbi:MAG: dephospho-CoA kinase [Acidobacteria bacterium]|nr:dephospho-CoA kinase [Acidobacteriota bacterium]